MRELRRHPGGRHRLDRDRNRELAVREHGHEHGHERHGSDDHDHAAGSTTTTTTTTSAEPSCRAAALSLSFMGQQGGMGHGEIGFVLRNTGNVGCRTYGYPGILFLDQGEHPLPTIPHHTTSDFFGNSPAVPLLIVPAGPRRSASTSATGSRPPRVARPRTACR